MKFLLFFLHFFTVTLSFNFNQLSRITNKMKHMKNKIIDKNDAIILKLMKKRLQQKMFKFYNNSPIDDKLYVFDNSTIDYKLDVFDNSPIDDKLYVFDNSTIDYKLDVFDNSTINDKLYVFDNSTIDAKLDVSYNSSIIDSELL